MLFGIVAASLVVLTGWAGQVSLGQMAFVGVGAAVGGALTDDRGWDLALADAGRRRSSGPWRRWSSATRPCGGGA